MRSSTFAIYFLGMTKMGRPKLPARERKTGRIEIRVTTTEQAAMEAAATKAELPLSEWLRELALRAARRASEAT